MSGPLYKFYFVNYTFVAKSVRKELLTKKSWVRFSVDIVFLLSNFTIFRPGEGGGRNGRPHLLFDSTSESEIFSYPKNMFETLF